MQFFHFYRLFRLMSALMYLPIYALVIMGYYDINTLMQSNFNYWAINIISKSIFWIFCNWNQNFLVFLTRIGTSGYIFNNNFTYSILLLAAHRPIRRQVREYVDGIDAIYVLSSFRCYNGVQQPVIHMLLSIH